MEVEAACLHNAVHAVTALAVGGVDRPLCWIGSGTGVKKKPSSLEVHARCGKPWSEHRLVGDAGWPRCDDEDEFPIEPTEEQLKAARPPSTQKRRKK